MAEEAEVAVADAASSEVIVADVGVADGESSGVASVATVATVANAASNVELHAVEVVVGSTRMTRAPSRLSVDRKVPTNVSHSKHIVQYLGLVAWSPGLIART